MSLLAQYETILWDFDGVLIDSMHIRDKGFMLTLSDYPAEQVQHLLLYHRANGGLSRYVKFRYFFDSIRNDSVEENKINTLASAFSEIMKMQLCNPQLLIKDTLEFIKFNYHKFNMHIVSGSDENELNMLCKELNISQYFLSIHGSPTSKQELIAQLLKENNYKAIECVLIGDSVNDFEAANSNKIEFIGYNNTHLEALKVKYITSFCSHVV